MQTAIGVALYGRTLVCRPVHRVVNDKLNGGVVKCSKGFMSRLEVKNLSVAAVKAAAASEHFAAVIPANHNQAVRLWNVEPLAIGFLCFKLKIPCVNALNNGA